MTDPQAALRARAEQLKETQPQYGVVCDDQCPGQEICKGCPAEWSESAMVLVRDLLAALVGARSPAQDEQ